MNIDLKSMAIGAVIGGLIVGLALYQRIREMTIKVGDLVVSIQGILGSGG